MTKKIREYLLKTMEEEGIQDKVVLMEKTYAYMSDFISKVEKDPNFRNVPVKHWIDKMAKVEREIAEVLNEMFERRMEGGYKKITAKEIKAEKPVVAIAVIKKTVFTHGFMQFELD